MSVLVILIIVVVVILLLFVLAVLVQRRRRAGGILATGGTGSGRRSPWVEKEGGMTVLPAPAPAGNGAEPFLLVRATQISGLPVVGITSGEALADIRDLALQPGGGTGRRVQPQQAWRAARRAPEEGASLIGGVGHRAEMLS